MQYKLVNYDEERKLRFDINALCDAEQAAGRSFGEMSTNPGFFIIRCLLWAGLKTDSPKLTQDAVGKIMHKCITEKSMTLLEIFSDCEEALRAAGMVKGKDVESDEKTDEKNE